MAALMPQGKQQYFTAGGIPLVGGKVYTYAAGTTTPLATYTTAAAGTPNTNPVILDSRGEASIFFSAASYKIVVKDSLDSTIWTQDNLPGDQAATIVANLAASTGSSLVGHIASGAGSVATTVQTALRQLGCFASGFTGYDATGATDSTTAIQAAIDAAIADGTYTVYITGKPKITAALTYTGMLSLVGVCGDNIFTNSFDLFPVRISCGTLTGYVFDQPDVSDGSGGLSISNICFDGRVAGVNSTTWQGLVKGSTTVGESAFFLRLDSVLAGNSNSTTALLDLSGEVFALIRNSGFFNWGYGLGVKGSGLSTSTTITFDKCYWNSWRQVYEFTGSNFDVTFSNCVFESSVVCGAAINTSVKFNDCYSENIGYDVTATGLTTGVTDRALGLGDIAGNVSAAHTCRSGQMIFKDYTIAATTGGKKWFEGIGQVSGAYQGGLIELQNLRLAVGTLNTIFAATTYRHNFEYRVTVAVTGAYFTEADARLITSGRVPIRWSDGVIRPVIVNNGYFEVPSLAANGFSAVPAIYPDGGTSIVGDVVNRNATGLQACGTKSWICTTAGAPGKWDTKEFIAASERDTALANGGTLQVPVALEEQGDIHVYEIMASVGGAVSYSAVNFRINHLSGGSGTITVQGNVNVGVTCAYTHGNGYFTITNGSGSTIEVYARLVSRGRTHT